MDTSNPDRTVNPFVQPQVYEAERLRLSAAAVLARGRQYDAAAGQFFRTGVGQGQPALASQSLVDSLVNPYDPASLGPSAVTPGLPVPSPAPTVAAASSTEPKPTTLTAHTNKPPPRPTEHALRITHVVCDNRNGQQHGQSEESYHRSNRNNDDWWDEQGSDGYERSSYGGRGRGGGRGGGAQTNVRGGQQNRGKNRGGWAGRKWRNGGGNNNNDGSGEGF